MKIQNIRYGFATNSSSSHSVVLAPGLKDNVCTGELGYGWENFVLATEEEKRKYLFTAAFLFMRRQHGQREAAILAGAAYKMAQKYIDIAGGEGECEFTSCSLTKEPFLLCKSISTNRSSRASILA